jgi:hypothetical protein
METLIVFPNLLGVLIRISWFRSFHPFTSMIFWNDLWKAPGQTNIPISNS